MDLNRFKVYLQNSLSEGLMLVIGSGLSCAEGLPGMTELETVIQAAVDLRAADSLQVEWDQIRSSIALLGLEGALKANQPSADLGVLMTEAIAGAVSAKEAPVISQVLSGARKLPLSSLFPLMSIGSGGLPILTTNYDRLVELACVMAGLSLDTLFDGDFIGRLAPDRWKFAQIESVVRDSRVRGERYRYRRFARVLKPHGSLDWWHSPDGPMRFVGKLAGGHAIVTPGLLKYREGYNEPYNSHRNEANEQLVKASRLLFIGYGFNDDHLEATSLLPLLQAGKEAIVVALTLTPTARALVGSLPKVTAIEAIDPVNRSGTRVHFQGEVADVPSENWWNLQSLIDGVLAP